MSTSSSNDSGSKESESTESIEKICRFCFESGEGLEKGNLIRPCRCDGSLKYIHEKCLETWLQQRDSDDIIIFSKCEICSYFYKLDAETVGTLSCSHGFSEGFPNLLASIGLAFCLSSIIWVVIRYWQIISTDLPKEDENIMKIRTIQNGMIIVCIVMGVTFFISMIWNLKKAFCKRQFISLKIHEFDPKYQQRAPPISSQNENSPDDDWEANIFGSDSEEDEERDNELSQALEISLREFSSKAPENYQDSRIELNQA